MCPHSYRLLLTTCQNPVKRMTYDEQCFGELWEKLQGKRQRPFNSGAFCSLDGSRMCFHDSCVKHSHSIYITYLFLLDVRSELKNPIWPVYPESGYGLLPCFDAFPDIIHCLRQTIVFRLICPEKVLLCQHLACTLWYLLTCLFFLNSSNLPWIAVFLHSWIQAHWNWIKVVHSIRMWCMCPIPWVLASQVCTDQRKLTII